MSSSELVAADPAARIADLRRRADVIRQKIRKRLAQNATGIQVAAAQTQAIEEFLLELLLEHIASVPESVKRDLLGQTAVVAVGGTGRGDMAPCSDVDLLFVHRPGVAEPFQAFVSLVTRDIWDAGFSLGHSVRTVADTLRMARNDPQLATTLVDARCLWGSAPLVQDLLWRFRQHVIGRRLSQFIQECIAAREKERAEFGATVQQLEPDVKRSLGGLRDLHLIRWIGYALYGVSDPYSLRLQDALSTEDANKLIHAHEFLTSIRINLHLQAGRPDDVLTRDEQLRIAEERGITATAGQRPVERFMQQYFEHSMAVAEITARFVARHEPQPLFAPVVDYFFSRRVDEIYLVSRGVIDVQRGHRQDVCGSLEGILRLYLSAVRNRVQVAPLLVEAVKRAVKELPEDVSGEAARLFLEILGRPGTLGAALRSLYDVGVLELVLPALRHTRCLLQFNQYHSYTVDEHTLRTIEAAERLEPLTSQLGQAYREIHHKEILHLALLIHDAGKGFEEDHSDIGKRLAQDAATRFRLPDHQRDLLVFLVYRHLLMATLAFRRDTTDAEVLLNFNHEVGSPDALRMLYVLTAADITAVGPGVWNDWKAELLTSFYDRSMIWLSGKSYLFEEPTRLQRVLEEVQSHLPKTTSGDDDANEQLRKRLAAFPTHYLLATPPDRIAADILLIERLAADQIEVETKYEPETRTVEYRVIAAENVSTGCFHKITGALSAKRLEILTAQISTSQDGVIVDSYLTRDYDHDGEVPAFRQQEIATVIRKVLRGEIDVEAMFRTRTRFAPNIVSGPVSNLERRVVIDNESSDRYTIIDIFAHDLPGLLYRIARTLFECELSVVLAKISTHFDQVVDVFYVTDEHGKKLCDSQRIKWVRESLESRIDEHEAANPTKSMASA